MSSGQTKEMILAQLNEVAQAGADAMAAVREPLSDQETSEDQEVTLSAGDGNEDGVYLVRGAKLCCSCGSHIRKANLPICHGVYVGENPALHEADCTVGEGQNITWFGICTAEGAGDLPGDNVCFELTEENNVNGQVGKAGPGKKCQPDVTERWKNSYAATKIVDNLSDDPEILDRCNTITTKSFLVCNHGGIIKPLSSGQEYEMTEDDLGCNLDDDDNDRNGELWDDILKARESGLGECGEADCFLAHERHPKNDPYIDYKGDIHGEGYYRVVYQYQNGEIIDIQHVKEGDSPVPPDPQREGYIFLTWNEQQHHYGSNDLVITAVYKVDASDPEFVKQYIWDFFINEGFSVYAVAGIMGNICVETDRTFDPTIPDKHNVHFGLFQLDGDRLTGLKTWAYSQAIERDWPEDEWDNAWTDVQFQCEYAVEEYYKRVLNGWQDVYFDDVVMGRHIRMQGTHEAFEGATDVVLTAMIWAASYERCFGGSEKDAETGITYYTNYQGKTERCEMAARYLETYGGIEP